MKKYFSDRNKYYHGTVKRMVQILEERDMYTVCHSHRVAESCLYVGPPFGPASRTVP